MNVEDLFRQLSYGELSGLSIGTDGSGSVPDDRQEKIISYANDGLTRLHSEFILIENSLIIGLRSGITNYHLTYDHAQSNPNPKTGTAQYILDGGPHPFQDDLLRILSAYNMSGCRYPLNEEGNKYSLYTPQPKVLQISFPGTGGLIQVLYQARHPLLTADDLATEINLPDQLHEALKAFIAHKVFSHMNGQDNSAKAQEHLNNFQSICKDISSNDLVSQSISNVNCKLEDRGFV